eukprot:TRINITY_DN17333_c1_g1_i1.p1 TRINITY_DN17333_c1_g1~~TRINITY_DN17333_c1_g1_i1.p1  ORF type:complete len:803 (+),score=48.56 TRINITY_DN17333_c1_g1_i1:67-2475(+)
MAYSLCHKVLPEDIVGRVGSGLRLNIYFLNCIILAWRLCADGTRRIRRLTFQRAENAAVTRATNDDLLAFIIREWASISRQDRMTSVPLLRSSNDKTGRSRLADAPEASRFPQLVQLLRGTGNGPLASDGAFATEQARGGFDDVMDTSTADGGDSAMAFGDSQSVRRAFSHGVSATPSEACRTRIWSQDDGHSIDGSEIVSPWNSPLGSLRVGPPPYQRFPLPNAGHSSLQELQLAEQSALHELTCVARKTMALLRDAVEVGDSALRQVLQAQLCVMQVNLSEVSRELNMWRADSTSRDRDVCFQQVTEFRDVNGELRTASAAYDCKRLEQPALGSESSLTDDYHGDMSRFLEHTFVRQSSAASRGLPENLAILSENSLCIAKSDEASQLQELRAELAASEVRLSSLRNEHVGSQECFQVELEAKRQCVSALEEQLHEERDIATRESECVAALRARRVSASVRSLDRSANQKPLTSSDGKGRGKGTRSARTSAPVVGATHVQRNFGASSARTLTPTHSPSQSRQGSIRPLSTHSPSQSRQGSLRPAHASQPPQVMTVVCHKRRSDASSRTASPPPDRRSKPGLGHSVSASPPPQTYPRSNSPIRMPRASSGTSSPPMSASPPRQSRLSVPVQAPNVYNSSVSLNTVQGATAPTASIHVLPPQPRSGVLRTSGGSMRLPLRVVGGATPPLSRHGSTPSMSNCSTPPAHVVQSPAAVCRTSQTTYTSSQVTVPAAPMLGAHVRVPALVARHSSPPTRASGSCSPPARWSSPGSRSPAGSPSPKLSVPPRQANLVVGFVSSPPRR